jgi:hypothetical protein
MYAYILGMAPSTALLTTDSLENMVRLLAISHVWKGKAHVTAHDSEWRSVRRRSVYRPERSGDLLAEWHNGQIGNIGLLTGNPVDVFELCNAINFRRASNESRRVSDADTMFIHCLLSLNDIAPATLCQEVGLAFSAIQATYGFVYLTDRMICAASELNAATNASCMWVPGIDTPEARAHVALERDGLLLSAFSEIGSRMLDVYWANYLTGSLRDRVCRLLEASPAADDGWEKEHMGDSMMLRASGSMMTSANPDFLTLRSAMRRTLASECILAPWSGFV